MTEPAHLRHLVACVSCHRQFDASHLEPGSRFHCACGELVEVRPPSVHESAVVRCSACGAPRLLGAAACQFCASDFTLHERDLDTICPGCATRISRRARYCHACALPIAPQGSAGEPSDSRCPTCGSEHRLISRSLGDEKLSVLECPRCAGLWLGGVEFQRLEERTRGRELDWTPERTERAGAEPIGGIDAIGASGAGSAGGERMYRPCPSCNKLMNRRNYGRRSGVIVDVCSEHGIWFDLGELARILAWIRDGGLAHAQQQELVRMKEEARHPSTGEHWLSSSASSTASRPLLGSVLEKVLSALLG